MKFVYLDTFPGLTVLSFLSTHDNYDHRFRNDKDQSVSLIGLASIIWTVSHVVLMAELSSYTSTMSSSTAMGHAIHKYNNDEFR